MGVLKIHSSGVVTSSPVTSSSNQTPTKVEIHSNTPAQTITNAQVCLDPMTLNDVDVRTNQVFNNSFNFFDIVMI